MGFLKNDKMKGYLQLILVICFIAFSLMLNSALQSKKVRNVVNDVKQELYVRIFDAKKQSKRLELNLTGVFKARSEVDIIAQVSGRVIEVDDQFFKGGVFAKDQTLFLIEPQDYILEVNRLEAEVKKAETIYDLERAEAKAALLEWYQLHPDKKQAPELVARKPQLREALANLRAAQASLQNAKLDLQRTEFSLPFSGRVQESSIYEGQYVSASQSYGRVYDVNSMEVESAIYDDQAAILHESGGDIDVEITTKYLGKHYKYKGVLKRAFSEYEKDTRLARIIFAIDGQCSNKLFPGIFANIKVLGKNIDEVMVLPIASLQNSNVIWHVENGVLKQLNAKILFANDQQVVVKTKLSQAKIVVGKIAGAFAGMKVRYDTQPVQGGINDE